MQNVRIREGEGSSAARGSQEASESFTGKSLDLDRTRRSGLSVSEPVVVRIRCADISIHRRANRAGKLRERPTSADAFPDRHHLPGVPGS